MGTEEQTAVTIASVQQAAFGEHVQYQFRTENSGGQVRLHLLASRLAAIRLQPLDKGRLALLMTYHHVVHLKRPVGIHLEEDH